MNPFQRFDSVYQRLMSNVTEDGDCWLGTERDRANYGYCRTTLWVTGLDRPHKKLLAHILVFCFQELQKIGEHAPTNDELYLAYLEVRESGFEIDHTCNEPRCRRPIHLQLATRREKEQFKHERRLALPVPENVEPEPDEIMF